MKSYRCDEVRIFLTLVCKWRLEMRTNSVFIRNDGTKSSSTAALQEYSAYTLAVTLKISTARLASMFC